MKRFGNPLLSLSAPLMIIVTIISFLLRNGSNRMQALPAFFVGAGLIISGALVRHHRRHRLLTEIRKSRKNEEFT